MEEEAPLSEKEISRATIDHVVDMIEDCRMVVKREIQRQILSPNQNYPLKFKKDKDGKYWADKKFFMDPLFEGLIADILLKDFPPNKDGMVLRHNNTPSGISIWLMKEERHTWKIFGCVYRETVTHTRVYNSK